MGRPKGSKNKKPGEVNMQTELEEKSVKTVDQVLEQQDRAEFEKKKVETELIEFYNIEEPGHPITFSFGPAKRTKKYTLLHGGKYELPKEIIHHLESRQTPMYDYKPDGLGRMSKYLKGYQSRFQCRAVR